MSKSKVLMVVTNGQALNNEQYAGVWFSEVAEPLEAFEAAGYEVVLASPLGGDSYIDPNSMKDEEGSEETKQRLTQTVPLSRAKAQEYNAVFLAGGHGAMFDFPNDVNLQNFLTDFATMGKPIGAVCHGVAGLVGARLDKGNPLVEKKRLTGFTNEEEEATGLKEEMPFLLQTKLEELEAEFIAGPAGEAHVETDGGLVTGQNPNSSLPAAQAMIALLQEDQPQDHNQARAAAEVKGE